MGAQTLSKETKGGVDNALVKCVYRETEECCGGGMERLGEGGE